jgi:beta-galactosidase
MAVDRDRWVGAPIDVHGIPRRLADEYHALIDALDRVGFHALRRRVPVRLVVPRALRRLARATHAFGPVTPAVFNIGGRGSLESCLEDDFGLGEVAPIVGESYVRAFERALLARGVPFAYAGGESLEPSIHGAAWVVCTTAGGVKRDVIGALRSAHESGVKVTIGPRAPRRDGAMREVAQPYPTDGLEIEPLDDPGRADALVARRIDELDLPTYTVDVVDVHVTIHEDADGAARVAFVMNPTSKPVLANLGLGRVRALEDLLPRGRERRRVEAQAGRLAVEVPGRTVRIFAVVSADR